MSSDVEVLRRNYEELQQSFDVLKREALKAAEPLANVRCGHGHSHGVTILGDGPDRVITAGHIYTAQAFIARWGK